MNRAVEFWVVLSTASALAVACAGKSTTGQDEPSSGGSTPAAGGSPAAGGTGPTYGGSAPAAAGANSSSGGKAAVGPPAQGNLTLSVQPPSTSSSGSCPQPGYTYELGNPRGPNQINPGDRLIDGEGGALIQCSVVGNKLYKVAGTIQGMTSEGESVKFTIADALIDAETQTGTAMVSVYTSKLGGIFSGVGCTLTVVGDNVKPGSLWTTVSCPSITSSTAANACGIGSTTTVVFENCQGA